MKINNLTSIVKKHNWAREGNNYNASKQVIEACIHEYIYECMHVCLPEALQ